MEVIRSYKRNGRGGARMYIVVTEAAEPCKAFGCIWRESTVLARVTIKTNVTSHAQWDAMYMHFAADGLEAVRRHG
jgi:hypothetical protein